MTVLLVEQTRVFVADADRGYVWRREGDSRRQCFGMLIIYVKRALPFKDYREFYEGGPDHAHLESQG